MGRKQGAARTARSGINGREAGVWQKIKQLYLIFLLPFFYFVVFRYGAMGWLRLAFKDHNAVEGLWVSEQGKLKPVIEFFQHDGLLEAAAQHAVGGAARTLLEPGRIAERPDVSHPSTLVRMEQKMEQAGDFIHAALLIPHPAGERPFGGPRPRVEIRDGRVQVSFSLLAREWTLALEKTMLRRL